MGNRQDSKNEIMTVLVDRVRSTGDTFSVFTGTQEGALSFQIVTVKCFTGPVRPGQRWILAGSWQTDIKWGRQYVAQFGSLAVPRDMQELSTFLTSGLVAGWTYEAIYDLRQTFGADTYDVVAHQPHRLHEAGITDYQLESLQAMWARGAGLAPVYSQLADWGIGAALADRLVRLYGYVTADTIKANPYAPIETTSYYTWRVAESIRERLDVADDDPRRITAGVCETLRTGATEQGHTWLRYADALDSASWLLNVDHDQIAAILEAAMGEGTSEHALLVQEGEQVYPGALWNAERAIAAEIASRLDRAPLVDAARVDALPAPETLSREQWSAVQMALSTPVSLLTGGPGVGKTTTLRELVNAAQTLGVPATLLAPTGKAAQRMQQATGQKASTIHRALHLAPGQLHVDDDQELLYGIVIVDEVSMLDTIVAAALFSGIAPSAHVLLVGDPDQLPSVGPGAVLRDLLAADICPRVHLTRVYRNDAGIAINAAHIRAGESIMSLPDCQIRRAERPADAAQQLIGLLTSELPARGYTPDDVLVLTPTNDGESGRHTLNTRLQAIFNAERAGQGITQKVGEHEYELRMHDRVIVTKNSTELGVFNGETGTVVGIQQPKTIITSIDGREVRFTGAEQKMLQLAYAITGHKAQGSEAPVVIMPVFGSRVLSREWLYTSLTRARAQVYLLGDPGAIQGSIRIVRVHERRTGLVATLGEMVSRNAPQYRPRWPYAYVDGSSVYHTRRQAAWWHTSCGLDTREPAWGTVPDQTSVRPCLRCQATSGAVLVAFREAVEVVEAVS